MKKIKAKSDDSQIETKPIYDTSTASYMAGPPFPCGCTVIYPHSHLVANHNCPCENGRPELLPPPPKT